MERRGAFGTEAQPGENGAQPGPGIGAGSAQRLGEVAPHDLDLPLLEGTPLNGQRLDHMQPPSALGQAVILTKPRRAVASPVAHDDPRPAAPEAVAHQHPAARRAVHDRVGE